MPDRLFGFSRSLPWLHLDHRRSLRPSTLPQGGTIGCGSTLLELRGFSAANKTMLASATTLQLAESSFEFRLLTTHNFWCVASA